MAPDGAATNGEGNMARLLFGGLGSSMNRYRLNSKPLLDSGKPEVLIIGDLLINALTIEEDLRHRLSKQRKNRALLRQWKEYQRLVDHLAWEYRAAVHHYSAGLRGFRKR